MNNENPAFSWIIAVFLCLSLGLAPYSPEPHLVEKLKMLFAGNLVKPIDIFDLCLHAAPWVYLGYKIYSFFRAKVV